MKIEERINKIIDEKEQYQLQALRLEAENKRLKEVIIKALKDTIIQWKKEYEILDSIIDLKDAKIAELKAENERLKQEWRLDCLKCEYKNTKADVDKYKQTLQEIKEIAEFHITEDDSEDVQNDMKQILDIITKAESEEV